MKNRSKINFIIDSLMFFLIMAIGGLGLLMKYVLVPGSVRWKIYNSNVELYLWGWDRHQWGSIHLILGYILFGLLVLHILLHWGQIKSMFKNLVSRKTSRLIITFVFVPMTLILLLFSFVVPFDVIPLREGQGRHEEHRIELSRPEKLESSTQQPVKNSPKISSKKSTHEEDSHQQNRTIDVYGSMTLKQVEDKYRVPSDSLKKFLGIPLKTSDYENFGRLRRRYNFHMSDVERYVEKYHQTEK